MARPFYFRRHKQHRNSVSHDRNRFHFHRAGIEHLEYRRLLTASAYNWQNVAIGAGGFVDGIFYDPNNQNTIYARTDIGGLYKTTDDGQHWTQLLDFVGNNTGTSGNGTQQQLIGVLGFAIDPENSNNIYADVGEYTGTNGAVFYSTNGGQTWGQTNSSFYVGGNSDGRATGERIAVDPYNSNIVYLGSNDHGLWKSTDAGHSFQQVTSFSTSASVNFVLFNPYGGTPGSVTQNIFVGLNSTAGLSPQTTAPEPSNVWQSTDGGATWGQIVGTGATPGRNIAAVSVSSLSRASGTSTVHTTAANGFLVGDRVTIAGASPSTFNGTFTITGITNSTTFTFSLSGSTATATGTITAAVNGSWMPNHAALAPDGNLYLAYSNGLSPNSSLTNGGIFRYNTSTGVWTNISPHRPQSAGSDQFGYVGLALDPENSTTLVVTSFNFYSGPDQIWRTVNANTTIPTWTEIYDLTQQQNFGYGAFNTTRNSSSAPYAAGSGDGISNWAAAVAINPFNSNQLMYGTGQGIWATDNASNGGTNTKLTAPNSWYFPDTGIEFTAVGGVAAASSGVPLFSAMGDIFGFAHTTLTSSPAQGDAAPFGSANNVDAANNVIAIVGNSNSKYGYYSTNDGQSFQAFPTSPGTGNTYGTDTIAVSANGSIIVWSQSGQAPYYTTNYGTTWTASGGGMAVNGQIIADRVNPNDFYYHVGNNLYFSNNGGVSFTLQSSSAPSGGNTVANPFTAGDIWIAAAGGLYHSTNFGLTFSHPTSALTSTNSVMALGAPAPGQTTPAIYVFGTVSGFLGIYRSDDGGSTWTLANDVNHQWGGLIQTMAADPNVFGRVYLGINGRGVIMGNPANSLPSDWTDVDVNSPGNPGWSTTSTMLSNGTMVYQWILNGGGAGLTGNNYSITSLTYTQPTTGQFYVTAVTSTPNGLHIGDTVTIAAATPPGYNGTFAVTSIINSTTFTYDDVPGASSATGTITASIQESFNFAFTPISGSASITAQLQGMTNADGTAGTPQAGVMFRAGTSSGDVYAALVQTTGNQLVFQYRNTTGGSSTSVSLGSIPVGAEYIELTRSGNNFTAFYSADDVNWTQLGTTIAIASMPVTADVGLAATANFNSQLTSAKFANVVIRLAGDVNLDGHVDAADIDAMMQALTDTATYQSMNNLSSPDTTLILDANGDGAITNADLQFLLNRLLAGGGSFSQNENFVSAPATPLVPTLISSSPASASNTVSNPAFVLNVVPTTTASSSSSVKSATTVASLSATKHAFLASVDQFFDRFDATANIHRRRTSSFASHDASHDLSDELLVDLLADHK